MAFLSELKLQLNTGTVIYGTHSSFISLFFPPLVETTTVGHRAFLEYNASEPRQQTDLVFT